MSVSALTFLLLYGNVTRYDDLFFKAIEQNSSLFLKLCLLLVPYVLSMAIPFGFSLALALVVGSWATNREVTAVNSLGVNPFHAFIPICSFSIILSLISIFSSVQWDRKPCKIRQSARTSSWQNLSHLLIEEGEVFTI